MKDTAHQLAITAIIALIVITTAAALAGLYLLTTHAAVYELETGEYLKCTPQGGNELKCEVTHR